MKRVAHWAMRDAERRWFDESQYAALPRRRSLLRPIVDWMRRDRRRGPRAERL